MLIIPAIDLKDGRCVRLKQGDMSTATVFSDDPVAMAKHWAAQGAKRLHIVDLNGAVAGRPKNEKVIREMIAAVGDKVAIQLGGGIRDLDAIESYIDAGVTYVIVGTAAVKNPGFLSDACYAFPGHVIAGLDAKDGKVAVEGWSKMTGHDVVDLAKKFEEYGVEAIIYTDIGRDGMLSGINIDATVRLAQALTIPVIAPVIPSWATAHKAFTSPMSLKPPLAITGTVSCRASATVASMLTPVSMPSRPMSV